ncbi:MAG TPA: T9SS type A sorting domain-containing protein [Bacteroidales bacterium]|nr:T9SS type A sorting domain-containing protein [Bacteroidales bacterium]
MKRKNLLMVIFMLVGISAFSQTVALQSLSNVPVGTVTQDLTMTGFTNQVTAFQWSVSFDPAVITYTSCTDWHVGVTGCLVSVAAPGIITFVWADGFGVPINGVLCKINYSYVSATGACSNVSFGTYPTDTVVADVQYNYYHPTYLNGQICGVSTGIEDNSVENASVVIYPSVAKEKVNVKYSIPENGKITLGVYNLMGDEVQKISNMFVANNEYNQEINVSDLSSGLYFIKYQIETANINTVKTEKITIAR